MVGDETKIDNKELSHTKRRRILTCFLYGGVGRDDFDAGKSITRA
jgi:hypothetical protein